MANFTASVKIDVSHTFKKFGTDAGRAFKKTRKEARDTEKVFERVSRSIDKMSSAAKRMGRNMSIAAVGGMTASIVTGSKFQETLQELSAITGLQGKALKDFGDEAIVMSKKMGISAGAYLDGVKLIASAKPELLDQPTLLKKITDEALTLSKAGKFSLQEAADSLTTSMNQFGLSAEEASRAINVLAAGSKRGSSFVQDTSLAIRNAGVSARLAGLSFEETNAAIQTLAAGGIKGSEAGTQLQAVFLAMASLSDDFNPKIVGVTKALENFAEAGLDAEEMEQIFQRRGLKAAAILIEQRKKFSDLVGGITDTTIAYEQAEINMRTFTERTRQLRSNVEALLIKGFYKMEPTLTKITSAMSKFLSDEKRVNKAIKIGKVVLIGLLSVMAAVTAAQIALNIAMIANPVGLIIVGIAAAVALIGTAIGAIIVYWDDIVNATKFAVSKIISFFTDTTFGKLLMRPFLPIIKVIQFIIAGIKKIAAWRKSKKDEINDSVMEIEAFKPEQFVVDQSSAVKIQMDISGDGQPRVKNVDSKGEVDFSANVALMAPAI